jgi:hypothetical protein
MALLATIAALATPGTGHQIDVEQYLGDCHSDRCRARVHAKAREAVDHRLRHRCNHSVVACIDRAAHLHRVNRWLMRRRAWCESRMIPGASNGTHFGLFQFLPSTFATTPYATRGSVWSPKWNSLAAAWMQRVGRGGEWACA